MFPTFAEKNSLDKCKINQSKSSMKNRIHLFLITSSLITNFLLSVPSLYAQQDTWREKLAQIAEDEELDESTIDNMYEELSNFENNPIDLNTVSREQLERFPLLSFEQATSLADFLEKNRPLYSVYELRNVPRLDYNTIQLILPFFYVGEILPQKSLPISKMIKNGRNEVQYRFDKTLEERAGYGDFSDSILAKYPNRKYLGEDFYTSLKYSFSYRDKFQTGLVAEKDAGEPFFKADSRKGYDHYGFHFLLRDMGIVKTLALGDYRMSFGQGLILNNNFATPKSWTSGNLIARTMEPKRHFSTAESGYFHGAATAVEIRNMTITAFYSNQYIDTNLSSDGEITSLKTDGYHRVPLDTAKRNNTHEEVMGANVNYRTEHFQFGASGIYYRFNRNYNPTPRDYNLYYFRGQENSNFSFDYSYRFSRFVFGGETAFSQNGAVATLNSLQYLPNTPRLGAVSLSYRNYSKSYQALYGQAFSESGIQNEQGLYLGATIYPISKLNVQTYIDFIRYPYIRYNVDEPSRAIDLYANAVYSFSRNSQFELRYKLKQKEKNTTYPDENSTWVLPYVTHKLRMRYSLTLGNGWNFRTNADGVMYQVQYFPRERGWMISQNVGYKGSKKWQSDFYAGYFDTDSYNSRIYSYERNLLNTFYMPSFYGNGIRLALSAKYRLIANLTFAIKAGYSRYFDRDVIGSDTEQIDGNHRTDIFTYLKWQF